MEYDQLLETMRKNGSCVGAAIVRRDGIPAVGSYGRSINAESFAAMTAACWGAAEAGLLEWTESTPRQGIILGDDIALAVAGLDEDLLLVLVMDGATDIQALRSQLQQGQESLQKVLAG